jgi:hypothetical protein
MDMPQDRESGAKAMYWGHNMAQHIANYLNAQLLKPGRSNEAVWNDQRIVFKSAHLMDAYIGVTKPVLNRVNQIIAAIEDEDKRFSVYKVTSDWFRKNIIRESSRQKDLFFVRCSDIRKECNIIGVVEDVS